MWLSVGYAMNKIVIGELHHARFEEVRLCFFHAQYYLWLNNTQRTNFLQFRYQTFTLLECGFRKEKPYPIRTLEKKASRGMVDYIRAIIEARLCRAIQGNNSRACCLLWAIAWGRSCLLRREKKMPQSGFKNKTQSLNVYLISWRSTERGSGLKTHVRSGNPSL